MVERENIALVHIHSIGLISFLPALKKISAKKVWHARETISDYLSGIPRNIITNRILKQADEIIAITRNESAMFKPNSAISVIYNFVDFADFDKDLSLDVVRQKLPPRIWQNGKITVGMMSQFSENKGIEDFIKAAILVHEKFDNVRFILKVSGLEEGPPLGRRVIQKFGKTLRFWKKITKIVDITNSSSYILIVTEPLDIPAYLRILDIYVRPDSMGCPWGRDIIEAMAMGKPVVATGTCEEFVINSVTGMLVPPKDPLAMAGAITELLGDRARRQKMGNLGYGRAKELFDGRKNIKEIEKIYKKLLEDV